MLNVLRYLKGSWKAVLLILLLLVAQAVCDLTLPQYTSDLVDVGIQQSGVDHVSPSELRESTWQALRLLMTDEELSIAEPAYTQQDNGNYILTAQGEADRENLDAALCTPMVLLQTMQSSQGMDAQTLVTLAEAGQLTREQLLAIRAEVESELTAAGDSLLEQQAIQVTQAEYEALGYDLDDMQLQYLLSTGAKMLGISLVMVVAAVLVGLLASRVSASVSMDLRSQLFQKVISFGNDEMDQFSTASLITRSTNDIQQVQMVIVILLRMVLYAPILGIGGVLRVASTRTGMAWIIAVAVGAIFLLVAILMSVAMPKFKKMQTLIDRLNLVSREILTGLPVIRAFSREKYEEERFDKANRDLMRTQLFTNRVMTFMSPVMTLIMNIITVSIVWIGGHGVDAGTMQVGDMMAFITYTMQIVMAFLMLAMVSIMLPRASVSADRINEVLRTEPKIRDKENALEDPTRNWQGELQFHDVSFHYPDADADALEHISFTAKPGQTTAIIGSTGSGKSTLLNLIPRFFDVSQGKITLDGIDIRDMTLHQLHSLLGYVPQKGVLFSGDIESNLKFGGAQISDADMEQAAEIAQATEFISSKPAGYQSPISQGGSNVSGGQKQRLSIARAIAKHPKVFLFDDSFSALDYKTDVALRRALASQIRDVTTIIVAQRISTILHADQIIVMDEGKIAGIGTHEELMRTCTTYQEIARSQLSEKELGGIAE